VNNSGKKIGCRKVEQIPIGTSVYGHHWKARFPEYLEYLQVELSIRLLQESWRHLRKTSWSLGGEFRLCVAVRTSRYGFPKLRFLGGKRLSNCSQILFGTFGLWCDIKWLPIQSEDILQSILLRSCLGRIGVWL